jgi:dolichol-phosphate mannosyltransferase
MNTEHACTTETPAIPELSVVVPCFNEEQVLPALLERLPRALTEAAGSDWEIILVDDGSVDRTAELIRQAHTAENRIRGIMLSRNFGHQPAILTGMSYARGRFVGIMDADLQDPPEVLLLCLAKARAERLDCVFAERTKRDATFMLRILYLSAYRLINWLSEHPWPLDAGDFCVISQRVCRLLIAMQERTLVLRGLRSWVGLRQGVVSYDRPARAAGETKYSLAALCRLALNSIFGFSTAPLRLASGIGFVMSACALLLLILVILNRIFREFTLLNYYIGANPGTTTIVVLVCVVSSLLFFCLGILGEYLGLILREVKRRPVAIVGETVGSLRKTMSNSVVEAEQRTFES